MPEQEKQTDSTFAPGSANYTQAICPQFYHLSMGNNKTDHCCKQQELHMASRNGIILCQAVLELLRIGVLRVVLIGFNICYILGLCFLPKSYPDSISYQMCKPYNSWETKKYSMHLYSFKIMYYSLSRYHC